MDGCVQALCHSLQTLVITYSFPHIDLALSNMKELRILICDDTINLISIPQNLRCLHDATRYFEISLRQNFPKVPEKNELAILNWSGIKPTYGFWKNFERLTKLETLKLQFNKDKDILDIFWGRRKCVSNFDKLHMLRDICLGKFNGETILGFSSKHCNLRHLHLDWCDSLQSCLGVGDLFALEELSFEFCRKLKELPNLQQLTCLRKLHIEGCDSIVVVPGLGNLVALEEFIASYCRSLIALPDVHKLTNLQTLDLDYCSSLKGVPRLCDLKALQMLKIEHEALQGGFNFHKLNKLVTLHVHHWSGPPTFSNVVNLEHLHIREWRNGIETMPNLLNLARLQSVHIVYCDFKDVSCLGNLISLRSLSIVNCDKLETLPDMHKLTRLEELEVAYCLNIVGWAGTSISKSSDTLWVDQPTTGIAMALQTLALRKVGGRELPDLSLFPELRKLKIEECWSLERLISTIPMTALEWLEIIGCNELQEVPDLSQCRLLRHCEIHCCEKISLTSDEITKLEAMCPGLKVVFRPIKRRLERFHRLQWRSR
jgi:Leucine-rich repeat (LRR) protein